MAAVKSSWYVAEPIFVDNAFQGFNNLAQLRRAHERSISVALDSVESATFVMNVLDPAAEHVWLQTLINCLVCYRNGNVIWSGPLWTNEPVVSATSEQMTVTAVGWFQYLLGRLLKCGITGVNPMVGPDSTTSGVSQSYVAWDPTTIATDLVKRTNYEYPLPISIGSVEPNPNGVLWNVTYQQLQNIGQAIQTLSNIEGGFDFRVDPATLQLNLYYGLVKAGTTVYGRGQDRPNTIFRYGKGGNLSQILPTEDASKVTTQMTVLDQLSNASQFPAAGVATESILTYGMWQNTASISDITSLTITTAYAEAEVTFLEAPEVIWSFVPFAYNGANGNLQPFEDYDIGDFVYLTANFGCIQAPPAGSGISGPLPVRMFAFTLNLNDEGVETISDVETIYTQTS